MNCQHTATDEHGVLMVCTQPEDGYVTLAHGILNEGTPYAAPLIAYRYLCLPHATAEGHQTLTAGRPE